MYFKEKNSNAFQGNIFNRLKIKWIFRKQILRKKTIREYKVIDFKIMDFTVMDFKKMVLKEMEFEYQTIMDLIEKHLEEKKSNGF